MIKRIAKMVGEALPLLCMVVICLGAMIADVMVIFKMSDIKIIK